LLGQPEKQKVVLQHLEKKKRRKTTPGKVRNQERNIMGIKVDPGNGNSL